MKPLEYINLENEYEYVRHWAEKYCDAIGHCAPKNIANIIQGAEGVADKERVEILQSIKKDATDVAMYPLCRDVLISTGILSEEEVAQCDAKSATYGYPVSTQEDLENTKFTIACRMSENKTRISLMNERDPLYGMYQVKGGEHLAQEIRMREEQLISNADIVIDFSQSQDDAPAQ